MLHMDNYLMYPTEENLISTLSTDIFNRNKDLIYFYRLLLSQKHTNSIAIDGYWGSGKTFFVKQAQLLINAKNPQSTLSEEKRTEILKNIAISDEDDNCAKAVYFDAWDNDNNTRPVISIIYEITKQLSLSYLFEPQHNICASAGALIDAITGRNITKIVNTWNTATPLSTFKEGKDFEEKIKDFLSNILNERGNKLIIFIDELDRCKPSFAVQLLEEIKHYFFDDRIVFVFSINSDELQHTIKHYYGNSFDACRYLDRFFDMHISMPPADLNKYFYDLGYNDNHVIELVSNAVIKAYHFQIRDAFHYKQQVNTALYNLIYCINQYDFDFYKGTQFVLYYIVPIIIGLKIIDFSSYTKFINGEDLTPLKQMLNAFAAKQYFYDRLLNSDEVYEDDIINNNSVTNKKIVSKEKRLKEVYNAIFIDSYTHPNSEKNFGELNFDKTLKDTAINAASMRSEYSKQEE